jgi:hypothetical protein
LLLLKGIGGTPSGSLLSESSEVFKKKLWEDCGILEIAQFQEEEDGRCILETTGKRNPGPERSHGNHDGQDGS